MRKIVPLLLMLILYPLANVAGESYQEGVNYTELFPAYPGSDSSKVEVTEFFWYSCPHCFDFEPYIAKWLEKKADDTAFVRVPVVFNESGKLHAETFYALEMMGKLEALHGEIFHAIHEKGMKLNTAEAMDEFLATKGVDKDALRTARASFAVQTKVNRALDLSKRFDITGVPNVVVNGTYKTLNSRDQQEMIDLVAFLVEKSRAKKN